MNKLKSNALIKSFFISFSYVGLGTISILSVYPHDFFSFFGNLRVLMLLLTLPVNFISFGIRFMDDERILLVLFIQFFVFLLFWLIVFKCLSKKIKKR